MTAFGKYQIIRSLGKGGMGEVFLAHDPVLGRDVAIKTVHAHLAGDPSFAARFQREARIVAQLQHPNVVPVFEFDAEHDPPYMVLPFISGDSLKTRLAGLRAQRAAMPLEEAARILEQLAAGLDKAHERNIIHRDLKPANILFDDNGMAMLTDFGIAKVLSDAVQTLQISAPDSTLGTASYMSPEQAASRPVDARSDLYALGVVLFEMLTGHPPFQGDSAMAVMLKHMTEPPPDARAANPALPAAVTDVLHRALAKEPAGRFTSATELARAFRAASQGAPDAAARVVAAADAPTVAESRTPAAVGPVGAGVLSVAESVIPRAPGAPSRQVSAARERVILAANVLADAIGAKRAASIVGVISILVAALDLLNRLIGLADRVLGAFSRVLPYLTGFLLVAGAGSLLVVARHFPAFRRRALAFAAAIGVIGLGWGAWSLHDWLVPRSDFVVLIADFDGGQARESIDVAGRLFTAMQGRTRELGGAVQVERSREVYTGRDSALAAAERRQAAWVVWGAYDDKGVVFNVDAPAPASLMLTTLGVAFPTAGPAAPASAPKPAVQHNARKLAELREVGLTGSGSPAQISYFADLVVGLAYLANGDAGQAGAVLSGAIQRAEAAGQAGSANTVARRDVAYLYRGVTALSQGQVALGVKDLETAAALQPASADARYVLALGYAQTCNAAPRALDAVQESIRLDPGRADGHVLLGDLYSAQGRHDNALGAYLQARALEPKRADIHDRLAAAYRMLGRGSDADAMRALAADLRKADGAAADDSLEARIARGYARLNDGQDQAAAAEFTAARGIDPANRLALIGLAVVQFQAGDFAQVSPTLQPVLQADPRDGLALKLAGMALNGVHKTAEALTMLTRAVDADACDANAQALLGGLQFSEKNYTAAAKAFQAEAEITPGDALAWFSAGNALLFSCGDAKGCPQLAAAVNALQRAAEITPTSFAVNLALGSAYEAQDKPTEASAAWQRGLVTALGDEQKLVLLSGMGAQYARAARWPDAEAAFRQALAIASRPEYQRGLVQALLAQNKLDDTIVTSRALLAANAGDPVGSFALASALGARGQTALAQWRVDDAAADLRAALDAQPGDASRWYVLAAAEYARCALDAAAQAGAKAAAIDPAYRILPAGFAAAQGRDAQAATLYAALVTSPLTRTADHLARADYLLAQRKLDEVAEAVSLALPQAKVTVDQARAHELLAKVAVAKGNLDAAGVELAASLRAEPAFAPAQLMLGDLAMMRGDAGAAGAAYDKVAPMLPAFASLDWAAAPLTDINLSLRRALLARRQQRVDEANAWLDEARARASAFAQQAPGYAPAQLALGFVLAERGDTVGRDAAFAAAQRCDARSAAERQRIDAHLARLR